MTATGGGSTTTAARVRTTQPAAPVIIAVVSNKLASVFFIAILLGRDLESKPETRRIAKHSEIICRSVYPPGCRVLTTWGQSAS
jgi:hypothetical protein